MWYNPFSESLPGLPAARDSQTKRNVQATESEQTRMNGYITVYQPDLKFRDFYRYREYYCGLCRALGRKYRQSGRLSLSYDMSFLAILLDAVYDAPTEAVEFRCPLHPFRKKRARQNVFVDYAADMNLYMTGLKCLDDWRDDRNLIRGGFAVLLSGRMKRIEAAYPDKIGVIREAMEDLRRCEQAQSTDFESAAGCFGRVSAELFRYGGLWDEQMARMGFYLGKYIYLLDAYDDLEEDLRKKRYNPLREISKEENYGIRIREILLTMISKSAEEFELLPADENLEILRNILYAGAWNSFEEAVRRKKTDPGPGRQDETPGNE